MYLAVDQNHSEYWKDSVEISFEYTRNVGTESLILLIHFTPLETSKRDSWGEKGGGEAGEGGGEAGGRVKGK